MRIQPLDAPLGVEITGLDLAAPIDDDTLDRVRGAWHQRCLVVFRDVEMTPAQHVEFSRRIGPLHVMRPETYNHPDHPEVFVVSNREENGRPVGMRRVGLGWHTDGEDKRLPNAGSLLYAREVPPSGGDTLYANMYAALDALPGRLRERIEGRRACYSRVRLHAVHYPQEPPLTEAQKAERPDVWHPLVRTHPETGRKALYIGRWACEIEGLPGDEGREVLDELRAFATQDRFVYRHRWRRHDAVLWDNRCLQHCATPFDDAAAVRHMHRTTLEGDVPR